jgi:hypothetical protein
MCTERADLAKSSASLSKRVLPAISHVIEGWTTLDSTQLPSALLDRLEHVIDVPASVCH